MPDPRVAAPGPPSPESPPGAAAYDVVHVTQAVKAGLRRYLADLITGLDALGVRQALVYSSLVSDPGTGGVIAALRGLGVAVFDVPMVRAISPTHDAVSAVRLWRTLRALRPRVVHLHSSKAGALGRLVAPALSRDTAVVYTAHGSAANFSPRYARIERLLGRVRTDRLIALSPSEHDELARLGYVAPERLVRVDTGMPVDEIRAAARSACPVLPQGRLVVAAGRLSPPKDPALLVRASRRLAAGHPDLRFVWIGDGELRGEVERTIAAEGVADRWTLLGWLVNPYPVLAAAEIVVLPSGFEAMPLVLLEAMALGRPMVATDVTGARDLVVPGETGELAPVGDDEALAAAIARIAGSPELAARYGAEGARRAAGYYTRERMASEMRAVYEDVARRR